MLHIITQQRDAHVLYFRDFKCWITESFRAGDRTCANSARACVLPRSPRSKLCMALWERARGRVSPAFLSETPTILGPTPFRSTEWGSIRGKNIQIVTGLQKLTGDHKHASSNLWIRTCSALWCLCLLALHDLQSWTSSSLCCTTSSLGGP